MKRALYLLLAAFVTAVPAVVASALLWHFYSASIFDIVPVQADEIMYWHQAATFAEAGFNGGYYTVSDQIPRIGRFYAWGAATPAFYGMIGRVFGWPLYAIAAINLAAITAATAAFIYLARLSWVGLIWLGVCLALYHPLMLYAPTQYLEVMLMALGLLLAGFFARLIVRLQAGQPASRMLIFATGATIMLAALFRIPWAALFIPLALLTVRPRTIRARVASIAGAFVLMVPPLLVYVLTSAPYGYNTITRALTNPTPTRLMRIFGRNISANISAIFEGDPLEIQMRAGVGAICLLLTLACGLLLVTAARRKSQPTGVYLAWFVLTAFFGFVLVIYEMYGFRGYRMLAAPVMFVLGLAIALRWRWALALTVVYLAVALPYTLDFYRLFNAFQTSDERRDQIEVFSQDYARAMAYDADAPNVWCNTITLDLFYLFGETSVAVAVPAGVGISIPETVWNSGEFPIPPKTHYIALPTARYEQLRDQLNIEPLLEIPDGNIYLNLNSPCEAAIQSGSE